MGNKVLQIGSGSMGTRRMRDLSARGGLEIALLELKEDRRQKAAEHFGIQCFSDMESALAWKPDLAIISTPPQTHRSLVEILLANSLPFFCEAELFPYDFREVERVTQEKQIVAAPSCTFYFLPIINEVKKIIQEQMGALHAFSYCLSLVLENWHPTEEAEYYAVNRETNGTREMVCFEMIGLSHIFGLPTDAAGTIRTGGELGAGFEDTWSLQMRFDNNSTGQLLIVGGSPQAIRQGLAVGENGTIAFDLMTGTITRHLPKLGIHDTLECGAISDVLESVYYQEINTFVDAVLGQAQWPYDYRRACTLSGTLASAEKSAITGRVEKVDPTFLPAKFPDQYA